MNEYKYHNIKEMKLTRLEKITLPQLNSRYKISWNGGQRDTYDIIPWFESDGATRFKNIFLTAQSNN